MSILANALPGFRDIRGALVAGYLWLLFGWLLVGGELETHTEFHFVRDVVELAQAAGAIWTTVALGVVAYLLGLVSRDISRVLVAAVRQLRRVRGGLALERVSLRDLVGAGRESGGGRGDRFLERSASVLWRPLWEAVRTAVAVGALLFETLTGERPSNRGGESALVTARLSFSLDRSDPIVRQLVEERARQAELVLGPQSGRPAQLVEEDARAENGSIGPPEAVVQQALEQLGEGLRRELDLPATLLVGEQPELFAEADRIRAESELRAAVVPPLLALTILLAAGWSLLWLSALVPITQLLIQGVRREDQARRLIGSALLFKRTKSAAVERFDRELAELGGSSQRQ